MQKTETIIEVRNVSMRFNLAKEKTDTLKEYFVKLIKHQLMFNEFYALQDVSLSVCKGDVISVMPFEFVTCHRASGVKYPLNDLTLNSSNLSYGLSNVATADEVEFDFVKGGAFVFRYEV